MLSGLDAFTKSHVDRLNHENFELFASGLISTVQGIRNIAIAPDGIQRYVYPVQGNEIVVGHDLLNDQRVDVQKDIQAAIRTREPIISGPYPLRQGGNGMVFRKAVYIEDTFWGLVSVVIDMNTLFEASGLTRESLLIQIAVRSDDDVLLGDDAIFETEPVIYSLSLAQTSFEIAAIPIDGWTQSTQRQIIVFRLLSALICVLLSILIYFMLYVDTKLRFSIKTKTQQLNDFNRKLEQQLDQRNQAIKNLQISEHRFAVAMENIPDGIVIYDQSLKIQYANESLYKITGRPVSDFTGKHNEEICPGTVSCYGIKFPTADLSDPTHFFDQ